MEKNTRGEETEARIIDAAIPIFAARGFRGATIRDVCAAAGVNVASVNYYFRSKEGLYRAVYERIFPNLIRPLLDLPATVHDQPTWVAALNTWVHTAVEFATRSDPPFVWASQLFAHERYQPTAVFPPLFEAFYRPMEESLMALVARGLPPGTPREEIKRWSSGIIAQCSYFAQRNGPWRDIILPPAPELPAWQKKTTQHIVSGITARLGFLA